MVAGRLAPSPTGPPHLGTMLSGLLAWLDARANGGRFLLRFEDLDRSRCHDTFRREIERALAVMGLDWDETLTQSEHVSRYHDALSSLVDGGHLYPCNCSRRVLAAEAEVADDGHYIYPGTCRDKSMPANWKTADVALRFRMPEEPLSWLEHGVKQHSDVLSTFGDPVVFRRDKVVAYHLAVVVDDAFSGITRVVRGRDIRESTGVHVALQQALQLPTPEYFHHFLLAAKTGGKLSKSCRSLPFEVMEQALSGPDISSWLMRLVAPTYDGSALGDFAKEHYTTQWLAGPDRTVLWTGKGLLLQRPL